MTDAERRVYLIQWVKAYCRNDFVDGLPGGVELFVEQAMDFTKEKMGINSESLGDYSISKATSEMPQAMLDLLYPYRRVKFV